MNRRNFIKNGLVASAVLVTGTSVYGCADLDIIEQQLVDDEVALVLTALLPVLLDGALSTEAETRKLQIEQTIAQIKVMLQTLPPHTLTELKDLFSLLSSRLANLALVGEFSRTEQLTVEQLVMLLEGLRNSYISLLNHAYDGLRELVMAAFYGLDSSWPSIGYNKPNFGA